MAVTSDNMHRVSITDKWWLHDKVIQYLLNVGKIENGCCTFVEDGINEEFKMALVGLSETLFEKNKQYGGSWQQDFVVTSLADLRDKLYRLHSASTSQVILEWDPNKLRGTLFDILARSIMALALLDLNAENIKADDDD